MWSITVPSSTPVSVSRVHIPLTVHSSVYAKHPVPPSECRSTLLKAMTTLCNGCPDAVCACELTDPNIHVAMWERAGDDLVVTCATKTLCEQIVLFLPSDLHLASEFTIPVPDDETCPCVRIENIMNSALSGLLRDVVHRTTLSESFQRVYTIHGDVLTNITITPEQDTNILVQIGSITTVDETCKAGKTYMLPFWWSPILCPYHLLQIVTRPPSSTSRLTANVFNMPSTCLTAMKRLTDDASPLVVHTFDGKHAFTISRGGGPTNIMSIDLIRC